MWVRLDDSMPDHPKVRDVSDRAFRLYVEALCYAGRHLTDGVLPASVARARGPRALGDLLSAGLVKIREDGTYEIHDYGDFNPSAAQVRADRAAARERQRKRRRPDPEPGPGSEG